MNDEVAVLLLGAGWAARRHADAIGCAGDRVVALIDPAKAPRNELAAATGADPFPSLGAWLASEVAAEAAVVASPSAHHLEQSTDLLERGLAVLIEKPHRLPEQRPDELLALAGRDGAVAQVGMTTRWSTGMCELRKALAAQELGDIVWVQDHIWRHLPTGRLAPWYFDAATSGGGVLITNGVHALDRVSWLLDEALVLVDADVRTISSGRVVEDAVRLRLRSASVKEIVVSLLWAPYPVPDLGLVVVGTEGTACVQADGSWRFAFAGGHDRHGPADSELTPFVRQWSEFRAAMSGAWPEAGVERVEAAIEIIQSVYAGLARP